MRVSLAMQRNSARSLVQFNHLFSTFPFNSLDVIHSLQFTICLIAISSNATAYFNLSIHSFISVSIRTPNDFFSASINPPRPSSDHPPSLDAAAATLILMMMMLWCKFIARIVTVFFTGLFRVVVGFASLKPTI